MASMRPDDPFAIESLRARLTPRRADPAKARAFFAGRGPLPEGDDLTSYMPVTVTYTGSMGVDAFFAPEVLPLAAEPFVRGFNPWNDR